MKIVEKISPLNWHKTLWKNGGGTTIELAIHPESTSVTGEFFWRVAIAQVEKAGPFSSFAGFTRTIVPLSHSTLSLRHGPSPYKLIKPFEPYTFSGDDITECKIEKPSEDLNVMVKRLWGTMHVNSLEIEVTQDYKFKSHCDFAFIYCAEGSFTTLRNKETLVLRKEDEGEKESTSFSFLLSSPHVMGRLITIEFFKNS